MDIATVISDFIIRIFAPGGIFILLGILLFILEILYAIFALIIIKQVTLMNATITTRFASLFTLAAFIHFFFAAGLVLFSLGALF